MIKNSEEYINKYGRTNDIVIGIVMFWCVTCINKDRYNLEYFNEKMYRFLDHESTEVQMNCYKNEMIPSIMDEFNNITTIQVVIDTIIDIYGTKELDYQLHMYGPSKLGSGDFWLENKASIMNQMGEGIFSIIASSNGVSLELGRKMDFLDADGWSELYKYYNRNYNIDKILS